MGRREAITGQVHEHVMLAMIVDPVRGNRGALKKAGMSCARMAHRVVIVGRYGMFGNIAQARNHREPCCHRQKPEHEIGPPHAC